MDKLVNGKAVEMSEEEESDIRAKWADAAIAQVALDKRAQVAALESQLTPTLQMRAFLKDQSAIDQIKELFAQISALTEER